MRGAVARALVVLGLCSSFLITSLSSRPCVCALILVSFSLVCVCVCVCVLGQPASRSPRRRTPTRRRSSSATPPPASVRPRPRATASTSTATTAPGACSSHPSSLFPPFLKSLLHCRFTAAPLSHALSSQLVGQPQDHQHPVQHLPPQGPHDPVCLFPPFLFFAVCLQH